MKARHLFKQIWAVAIDALSRWSIRGGSNGEPIRTGTDIAVMVATPEIAVPANGQEPPPEIEPTSEPVKVFNNWFRWVREDWRFKSERLGVVSFHGWKLIEVSAIGNRGGRAGKSKRDEIIYYLSDEAYRDFLARYDSPQRIRHELEVMIKFHLTNRRGTIGQR